MSEVLKQPAVVGASGLKLKNWSPASYLPAILPVVGGLLMMLLRTQIGGEHFISDGALMMLALACYLTAAVFLLTNLYAPSRMAERLGLWLGSAGVFFNLSSWLVRWIAAHDRELAILTRNGGGEMPWFFRYIPFSNLYDLSLAFAFGAGITTMLIARRSNFRFLGAVSLPLASIILILARFIGDELLNLQPILDSYWRPIHVGIASLSYGVALVCFASAVVYLLKDGVKPEAMAIWSSLFAIAIFGTINKYSVFTTFTYATYTFIGFGESRFPLQLRANVPYVGPLLILSALLLVGVIIAFGKYVSRQDEKARKWGRYLLKISLVTQALAIAFLVAQVKAHTAYNINDLSMTKGISLCADSSASGVCIADRQLPYFGAWLAEKDGMEPAQIAQLGQAQLVGAATKFIRENGPELYTSLNANPVELAALITAFAATLFVIIFSFRTERLLAALPAREKLDSLMYKTASAAFAGLAMLLITGAIWANESWGAYWSWDSKEVGALVAWLTYGAFLHARISRGMNSRHSAYFAIVAFLLVVFTYLGVSYLIPGMHSYA